MAERELCCVDTTLHFCMLEQNFVNGYNRDFFTRIHMIDAIAKTQELDQEIKI